MQSYDQDTDTDGDENNSQLNESRTNGGINGGEGSANSIKGLTKEIKNFKKSRKMWFFSCALVIFLILNFKGVNMHSEKGQREPKLRTR